MDSSGWTDIVEEEDDDPTQVLTIRDVITKRVLAREKAKGKLEARGVNNDGWGILPDLILEKVFGHLSIRDRNSASMVCRQWNRAFYMQKTWDQFTMDDTALTRRKYNYYSGWQYRLDHLRVQVCILRVGRFIRKLNLLPVWNLFNVYEFMMLLSYYAERYEEDQVTPCLLHVTSFRFIFWCNMATRQEQMVYGTGGKMLEALKRLMGNLHDLRNLELVDLILDAYEAVHLLDEVCMTLTAQLESLTLINATKTQCGLLHPGVFINLQVLKISPQNLCEETVEMLTSHGSLKHLYLVQNAYTETAMAVHPGTWAKVGRKFEVHLRAIGNIDREVIWQSRAPVTSVLYDCPKTKVTWESTLTTIEYYSSTLTEYGHIGQAKFTGKRKFSERADAAILTLCRKCPYLTSLTIRERISTCTALLIAGLSPNLKWFNIRRNALLKKRDFEQYGLELDYNFTLWLKLNATSFEKTQREIAKILDYDWKPLTDDQFKILSLQKAVY